jgi:hypothetical protein
VVDQECAKLFKAHNPAMVPVGLGKGGRGSRSRGVWVNGREPCHKLGLVEPAVAILVHGRKRQPRPVELHQVLQQCRKLALVLQKGGRGRKKNVNYFFLSF